MKRWLFIFFVIAASVQGWAQEGSNIPSRIVLEEPVNSEYTETRPFISFDGNHLYISRRRAPENVGGKRDLQDIYRCERLADGSWSVPVNLGDVVNTRHGDALACTSLDGKTLYLFDTNKRAKFALWSTTEQPDGTFTEKQQVDVANYYNKHEYEDFFISEQLGVMILAIQRDDSRGQQDLYVSKRLADGSYSEPQHMGATINSGKSEFAPYLSPEGDKLYFASFGFGGLGGSDIFYAERLDDSWTNWGRPRNMGSGINSEGQEIYFSFTEDFENILIESWDKAHHDRDIIQLAFDEPIHSDLHDDLEPVIIASVNEATPPSLTSRMEEVIDQAAESQREQRERNREAYSSVLASEEESMAIASTVLNTAFAEENQSATEAENNAPMEGDPQFLGLAEKYAEWIVVSARDGEEGTELKYVQNMHFATGSNELASKYFSHLDRIVSFMEEYPQLIVTVEGHTDAVGSRSVNMRLSQARAGTTAQYLFDKGVDPARVSIRGLGPDYPIAPNDVAGRELNRRIEIAFIPQGE